MWNNLILITLPYLVLTIQRALVWAKILQLKEYRIDRLRDYLSMPEAKKIIWSWEVKIMVFWSSVWLVLSFLNLSQDSFFLIIVEVLWFISLGLLALKFTLRIWQKRYLKPIWTAKILLILLLTTLLSTSLFLLSFNFNFPPAQQVLSWQTLFLLLPLILLLALGLIYPLDWLLKRRILRAAKNFRARHKNLEVIAISGAFGKTTTKEYLHHLLNTKFPTEKTLGNNNTPLSLAKKISNLAKDTKYLIAEVGAYKLGEGAQICDFLQPTASILTGLNNQHFNLFGSRENILRAETESWQFLKPNQPIIINWSNPMNRESRPPNKSKIFRTGIEGQVKATEVEIYAYNLSLQADSQTSFYLQVSLPNSGSQPKQYKIQTNLWNLAEIQNLLNAIAYLISQNLNLSEFEPAFQNLPQIPGRQEIIPKPYGQLIYNELLNFDGAINAINSLKILQGQKYLILDDIIELGKMAKPTHRELAKVIAQNPWQKILLLGRSYADFMRQELLTRGIAKENIVIWSASKPRSILTSLKADLSNSKSGNHILLLGKQTTKIIKLL